VGSIQIDTKAMATITPNSPSCGGSRRDMEATDVSMSPALESSPGIMKLGSNNSVVQTDGETLTDRRFLSGLLEMLSRVSIKVEVDAAVYVWGSVDVHGGSYFDTLYEATSPTLTVFDSLSAFGITAPIPIMGPFCLSGLIATSPLVSVMPATSALLTVLKLGSRVSPCCRIIE
jgi:hypothetical protein